MPRVRRRFSPAFFVVVAVALVSLASVPFWGVVGDQWQAWGCFRRLHDPTPGVRTAAGDELARLGPGATSWAVRALGDADPQVRILACSILPRTDPDYPGPIFDALIGGVKDPDPAVRQAAVRQLGASSGLLATRAGPEATERALRALGGAIGDPARAVRQDAASALGGFGPLARSAIPDLDRAFRAAESTFRVDAADALLRIDPVGAKPRVIPALRALLAIPAARGEMDRAVWLLKRELGVDRVAASLIPLLQHENGGVRMEALNSLTWSCWGADATLPAIRAALTNPDRSIRCDAALILLEHDPATPGPALDALVDQLVNLHDGGAAPESIIPPLQDRFPGSIRPVAARLVAALEQPGTPAQRRNAIYALALIGSPQAALAGPALRKAAMTDDRTVSLRAVEALARIDPPSAAPFLPDLLAWSRPGADPGIRLAALATLGALGPAASAAVPSLLLAADEEDIHISAAAFAALRWIDPPKAAELERSIRRGN